ncbi:tRNA lysidine(34) synthetase TilS [Raineyella sp. LH-20]|uniref:tRNA lysidine(34) synthetase TilS n=1 Tax=Raineyella sp. LH-20 TaxID=3081204 RepID=UPI0029532650|nr:tRNA lysidine(34) synthetase TilS [Raineyella sp. LH-20]WOP17242.1 tRNA lysidine(34) synthetase TilS [Raineyella sp. LH-20]
MARRVLGVATLTVARAVLDAWQDPAHDRSGGWLVGCSGGSDSLALAVGAYEACRRVDALDRLGAVIVDHGLQEGSAAVAATVREQLVGIGYPEAAVQVRRVRVDPARIRADGVEAAARTARYAAFEDALAAIDTTPGVTGTSGPTDSAVDPPGHEVLLAHTRDDQAETVLLGLVRGSGVRSLAGIAPRRGPYVRPLLDLTRATLRECCRENDLGWWEDPYNADDRYARARIRHRVLPVLEDEFGGTGSVAVALARTAALARVDADFLDALAEAAEADAVVAPEPAGPEPVAADTIGDSSEVASTGPTPAGPGRRCVGDLDCAELAFLPEALRTRVVRRWLVRCGAREPGAGHVAAVCRLVTHWRGQQGVDLPGLRVVRREGRLRGRAPGDVRVPGV